MIEELLCLILMNTYLIILKDTQIGLELLSSLMMEDLYSVLLRIRGLKLGMLRKRLKNMNLKDMMAMFIHFMCFQMEECLLVAQETKL